MTTRSPSSRTIGRRACLQGLASVSILASSRPLWAAADEPAQPIPQRVLGKTNVKVPIIALGGYHFGTIKDDKACVDFVRKAIDMGVTFLDNAWLYNDGRSEEMMGKALQDGYRQKVFLMTKSHGRDRKTAMQHLEDSLRRLKVDVIDLWQVHQVTEKDEPGKIMGKEGAIEVVEQAKKQGKARFVGFTGHRHPELHLQMLATDYPWDTVQMPVNALDPHFRSFIKLVLPEAQKRGLGIIGMKALAFGNIPRKNVIPAADALRFAWSQPISSLVSGMDKLEFLEANVKAAREFKPLEGGEQEKLLALTAGAGKDGKLESFKAPKW